MTARDFTPTDEHMQNLAEDYAGVLGLRDDFRRGNESDAYLLVVDGLAASPAFQSIIAAAKAEALRDLADEGRLAQRDGVGSPWMVAEWLNAEADRIEAGLPDEDDKDIDPEEFCSRCFAGVDSPEHHEKCVVTGHAEDGATA